jgi:hypothetical protein
VLLNTICLTSPAETGSRQSLKVPAWNAPEISFAEPEALYDT